MSQNPLMWKLILIVAVVAVMGFFSYPPEERINLGLDLRGGAHVLMQVETETALQYELGLTQSRLGQALKEKELSFDSILPSGRASVEVRGTDPSRRADVRAVLERWANWDLADRGAGNVEMTMKPDYAVALEVNAVEMTLNTLRNRVDSLGVAEPLVQKQGMQGDRILIQLPGVEDPGRVKGILADPAVLEWKAVTYPANVSNHGAWIPPATREDLLALFGGVLPADTEAYRQVFDRPDGLQAEAWWPLKRVSAVIGQDLRSAYRSTDDWGDPVVAFELTQDAGKRFENATRENVGRHMVIILGGINAEDKHVVSAPIIETTIRDQGQIRGNYTIESAEDMALKLNSGAIPTNVAIIEERTVGPSLGRDSIRRGLTAGIAGFIGVMLFMLVYYRLSGVNAVIALALNVLLVFGILGALPLLFSGAQATLTLPGIAGLILTVGMAVDSNVLIFERIREELRNGKTVRSAVEQGFGKALMTILDCNVTTLVAAFFLFAQGTGPVKGFAVTLTAGLLASMFTAVFVSRQLFEIVLSRKGARPESLSI
ncbi:MAG: protein translocase subunit SecD [bacterium]|nr:protein translocase subunit SecD [bacterium]